MAKDELDSQIKKGVKPPMVIVFQIFGYQLEVNVLTTDQEGMHALFIVVDVLLPDRSITSLVRQDLLHLSTCQGKMDSLFCSLLLQVIACSCSPPSLLSSDRTCCLTSSAN